MAEEKFAFESDEVSIAFTSTCGALGDVIIAKSVFDALVRLVPNCKIDIFHVNDISKTYVQAFYGQSKNLNRVLSFQNFYAENFKRYDVALRVWHSVIIDSVNVDRLENLNPNLLQRLILVSNYNQRCLQTNDVGIVLRNITRAHILGVNRYTCLSCDGALPIYDNHVEISLIPERERQFRELGLRKYYITIGSNLVKDNKLKRHNLKEWSNAHVLEYIFLLKTYLPQVEVVQIGGGGVYKFANADRHIFDADLELVKYVLKNSLLHVDCESGLVHLASQLGTKCLVLFGPTDAEYYGFKENLNVVSKVCRPCVWAWDNGSTCLRGAKEPPCMASITASEVFVTTCEYLKNNA